MSEAENQADMNGMAQQFGHALNAMVEIVRDLYEKKVDPAVLASATCSNYVGYVATMSKLIGMSEQEAFDTCIAGIHQLKGYITEIYQMAERSEKQ